MPMVLVRVRPGMDAEGKMVAVKPGMRPMTTREEGRSVCAFQGKEAKQTRRTKNDSTDNLCDDPRLSDHAKRDSEELYHGDDDH